MLKDSSPAGRSITQAVSAHLYLEDGVDGIEFASRHGDNECLWCVFEQPHEDPRMSPRLMETGSLSLTEDTAELVEAFDLLGLQWREATDD